MKKKTLLFVLFGSLLFLLALPFNAWAASDVPAKVYEMGTDKAPVPVSGVKVDVFVGRALKALVSSAETNTNGACLLRDIPLGKDVLVRLIKPDYVPQLDIRSYSDRDVEEGVILWMGSEVHVNGVYKNLGEGFDVRKGHVYLEIRDERTGEGIEGVRLMFSSGRVFELGAGEYLVANAEGTFLKMGIQKPGFAFDIESVTIPLFPGGITQYEVVVQPGGVFQTNGQIETVSAPTIPSGPTTGIVNTDYAYTTGGSFSSLGEPIQYLIEWGDGTDSGWLLVGNTSALKRWPSPGTYQLRAKARCSIHTDIESDWSETLSVVISALAETVSAPSTPIGPASGTVGTPYTYSTGGAVSSLGDSVEYFMDWGDGTESGWLPVGPTSAMKTWSSPGTYPVKAKARCAIHPSIESTWSPILSVSITSSISPVSPPNEQHFDGCSVYALPTFSWSAGETFKKYEVQFSLDPGFGSIPAKAKASGYVTGVVVKSSVWKKVMLIPGGFGGMVHWRVVGTRPNQSNVISEVRSFLVDPAQAVGSPNITNTGRSSLPELSWQNNCGVKFKVWFGNDENFTKKAKVKFNISNPYDNGGVFVKALSSNQWKKIRNLVKDVSGSTLYWYVESWDGLKRDAKTEVMSFVLTD